MMVTRILEEVLPQERAESEGEDSEEAVDETESVIENQDE